MEKIPARLLQHCAEAAIHAPILTERERKLREHLIDAARNMFIEYGPMRVDVPFFAHGTRTAAVIIRRHFGDMHRLLGIVLSQHICQIYDAICAVKGEGADLLVRRRAEYFRVTRGFCNVPTPVHFLLVKDRVTLPQDELEPVEHYRDLVGQMLGGEHGDHVLTILDHPTMTLAKAEALIATLVAFDEAQAAAQPQPEPAEAPRLPTPQATPAPPSWSPGIHPTPDPSPSRPADPLAALSDEDLLAVTSPAPQKPPPRRPFCLAPAAAAPPGKLERRLAKFGGTALTPPVSTAHLAEHVPKTVSLDSGPPGRMSARLAGPAA